jgi:prepilin-type processing-associated H-X9-DG protein
MNWRRISSRSAYTWVELVVVVIVLAVLLAMIPCCLVDSRGPARRAWCTNNLKQIGIAIHCYGQANNVFPPGSICSTAPIQPSNQYDVWAEAARTKKGLHGTSFLLQLLPFIEGEAMTVDWNFKTNVIGNAGTASRDIRSFYCPTRRIAVRPSVDTQMLLIPAWTGGGTDYGGCAGRHAAFTLTTGYNLCDATMYYEPGFFPKPFKSEADDTPAKRWGIFGRVNVSTSFAEVKDGLFNTIATGELQRITDLTPGSKDGWAVGGPATLFTTGAMFCRNGTSVASAMSSNGGRLMNNGFFGSPGSEHPKGANFGMADGSVQFIAESIDPDIFALMGSMDDGVPVKPGGY